MTTAPEDWTQNPYVQIESGFLAGLSLGFVPFGGVGQQILDEAEVLTHGTPQVRLGLAVGQIVGGIFTMVGGVTGDVLGGAATVTGLGAAIGVHGNGSSDYCMVRSHRAMNDYDIRQYSTMRNQIRLYEEGALGLNALISNLEALMACLNEPDDAWLADFRQQWSILEQVYAVAVDREQSLQQPDFVTSVALALERMKLRLSALNLKADINDDDG